MLPLSASFPYSFTFYSKPFLNIIITNNMTIKTENTTQNLAAEQLSYNTERINHLLETSQYLLTDEVRGKYAEMVDIIVDLISYDIEAINSIREGNYTITDSDSLRHNVVRIKQLDIIRLIISRN